MTKRREDTFRELKDLPAADALARQITRATALRSLGSVVYAMRIGDTIKIGHTRDLAKRVNKLHPDELLGFRPGTRDDERAIHEALVEHLHHGLEWYRPTAEVLAVVNDMRTPLGMEPIAA